MKGNRTMTTLKDHVNALQQAALSVEDGLRRGGYYSRDCNSRALDTAIGRGKKHGFAMLFDANGEPEIIPLGDNAGSVEVTRGKNPDNWGVVYNQAGPEEGRRKETSRVVAEASEEPYAQASGENFKKAASRSHERSKETEGRFPPQVRSGPKPATADAARISAELKAKQARNAADARAFTRSQFERNEKIFAAMKERSNAIHNR
jgi:hypothetical protein